MQFTTEASLGSHGATLTAYSARWVRRNPRSARALRRRPRSRLAGPAPCDAAVSRMPRRLLPLGVPVARLRFEYTVAVRRPRGRAVNERSTRVGAGRAGARRALARQTPVHGDVAAAARGPRRPRPRRAGPAPVRWLRALARPSKGAAAELCTSGRPYDRSASGASHKAVSGPRGRLLVPWAVVASYGLRRVPGPSSPETGLPACGLASFPGSEQEFVETPNWRALGRLRVAKVRRGKT